MSWVPCGCGNYWCDVHQMHAHDCVCPPIEEWESSPYAEDIGVEKLAISRPS